MIQLPFSLADEVQHSFDRPHSPQTVHMEIRVRGALDKDRLAEAIAPALYRHPMARARHVAGRRLIIPPQWEIADGLDIDAPTVLRSVQCCTDSDANAARSRFYSTPISIRDAPAVRMLHIERPDGDALMISLNHAIGDGIGALRLLRSIARSYDGRQDPLPPIDPLAMRDPGSWQSAAQVARRPPGHGGRFSLPPCLDVLAPSGDVKRSGYGFYLRLIAPVTSFRVDDRWNVPGATFNDGLLAAFHRAAERWNRSRGHPCEHVSILMPISSRAAPWDHEIVGNLVRSVGITSTRSQRANPHALLAAITEQTRYLKQSGSTRAPRLIRDAALLLLPLWKLPALSRRVRPAGVLTNMGRLDEACPHFGGKDGKTIELWAAAPAPMPTGASVGVATLQDRIHVALRFHRRLFDDSAAREFGSVFEEELRFICGWDA